MASSNNIQEQFQEIIKQYSQHLDSEIQTALTSAGEVLIDKLRINTPVGEKSSGEHMKNCWSMKKQYHNVRYVGNTKTVHDGIPLINLLEYGSKGHPFVINTFNINKDLIFNTFKNSIGGKNNG